ncbi:MAG: hypothetical protein JNM82_02730 [Rhodocyclaceae bacterium]|nr:hypothetical protein [Rhodocyclaceae bacterium]
MADRLSAQESRILLVADPGSASTAVVASLVSELLRAGLVEDAVQTIASSQWSLPGPEVAVVVPIGAAALRAVQNRIANRAVVALQVSRAAVEAGPWLTVRGAGDFAAVVLDQPLPRWMALVDIVLPARREVGVLLGPSTAGLLKPLEKAAADRNLNLHVEHLGAEAQLIPALERVLARANVVLALPDPLVHNRNTVQPLLLTTYRAGVPLVGYSEAYTNAGAILSLHTVPEQVGRQGAEVVLSVLRGRPPAGLLAPRQFRISANPTVARSLGIVLPPVGEIEDRIP